VFAPLARLLGLYSIKEELEALSFKHSQPAAHQVGLELKSKLIMTSQNQSTVELSCSCPLSEAGSIC
jgi:(p)ppGpp synthase/HD superfamily hydrolase